MPEVFDIVYIGVLLNKIKLFLFNRMRVIFDKEIDRLSENC